MSAGDFAGVYAEHVGRIHAFFAYRVRSREEAEDLTQLTFERALRAWPRYDPARAKASTWLIAIARNLLIDQHRATGGRPQDALEDHEATLATPGPQLPGASPQLERCLDQLSDRERELIALRYAADLRGPEIAELTGLSLANVQQILSRAQRKIRDALADQRSNA